MKKIFLFYLCVFLLCTNISFATNITIPDLNSSSSNSWYGTHEDQEVEPGMARSQAWDLEGFFVNGTVLSLVGGYDFKNGAGSGKKFYSGDIFIVIHLFSSKVPPKLPLKRIENINNSKKNLKILFVFV